jgi:hypothetical protein
MKGLMLHFNWKYYCEFRRARPPADKVFCIYQLLERKLEYCGLRTLFIDFKTAAGYKLSLNYLNALNKFR